MRITKRITGTCQQKSIRYYLSGFQCIPNGITCWIISDENGEALLDTYSKTSVLLQDVLKELLEIGLITEDEYWYPYLTVFDKLSKFYS